MSDLQLSPRRRKHAAAAAARLLAPKSEGESNGDGGGACDGDGDGDGGDGTRAPATEAAGATVWGTTLNLTATAMGAGMLSLPQASAYAGWLVSSISLIIIAVAADFSLVALVVAAEKSGKCSVEAVSAHFYGSWGLRVARGSLLLLLFGAAVILLVVGVDCLLAPWHLLVCGEWSDGVADASACHTGGQWISTRSILTILCAVIELPLVARPELSRLRFTSLLASAAIAFTAVLVLVKAGAAMSAQPRDGATVAQGVSAVPMSAAALMRALPIQGLSFCCQFNILPLYLELRGAAPTASTGGAPDCGTKAGGRDIRRVIHFSVLGTITLTYLLFGLAGYVGLGGAATPSNILRLGTVQGDGAVRVALALMGATNLLKFPLIFLPLRASLCDIISLRGRQSSSTSGGDCDGDGDCEDDDDEGGLRQPMLSLEAGSTAGVNTDTCCSHVCVPARAASATALATVSLLAVVCALALLCSDLAQVFDYVGATAGVLVCYVGPGMLFAAACHSDTQCHPSPVAEKNKGAFSQGDSNRGGCRDATAACGYALVALGIAISVSFFVSIAIG